MRKTMIMVMLAAVCGAGHSANLTIPSFHLLTRGRLQGTLFVLQTEADIDVRIGGGYKFGGELSLSVQTDNLEQPSIPGDTYDEAVVGAALRERLYLSAAAVVIRDLFDAPLDVRYFVGRHTRILNGDLFPQEFGSRVIGSEYRGRLAFPTGTVYDGLHAVEGTGLVLTSSGLLPWLFLEAALYQDAYLSTGHYSADVRAALNTRQFKAESFVGASYPGAPLGIYRGGLLLYYTTGPASEVFAQVGVPRWAPEPDGALNIDDFYFLFEPRVHLGLVSAILTLFWHPEYYVQAPTAETGAMDINLKLVAGDRFEGILSGGIDSAFRLRPAIDDERLRIRVAPFITISSSGVVWDLRAAFTVLPFDLPSLFEAYVGVRTEF